MTCIVGIIEKGITYIAGDSLGSNGHSGTVYRNKKVFHLDNNKEIISGYTDSYRMGQLLQFSTGLFDRLKLEQEDSIERYLVNSFIPLLRDRFSDGGYEYSENSRVHGGEFLLAYKDKLYKVQSNYSIMRSLDNYDACGGGENCALGALKCMEGEDLTPQQKLKKALESASKFTLSVQPPFYMVSTADNEITEL